MLLLLPTRKIRQSWHPRHHPRCAGHPLNLTLASDSLICAFVILDSGGGDGGGDGAGVVGGAAAAAAIGGTTTAAGAAINNAAYYCHYLL